MIILTASEAAANACPPPPGSMWPFVFLADPGRLEGLLLDHPVLWFLGVQSNRGEKENLGLRP